ncbi:12936_t:CDS:10 [Funneliformis caledonium]|uniref:Signal recognition particle subunit SRP72 n=1 Tax=Funneliformis caledonium TaxID=1117310 RepID=A0A9N9AXU7_9GLOM|nr:12936_t:CDS:10 [Funneliformis caledonium]
MINFSSALEEMADSKEVITQLFKDVERLVSQEEYAKVLRSIDKILQLNPEDNDALHCKVISYIRLGKYQNALELLQKSFSDENLISEKAYCFYRLNKFDELLNLLRQYKLGNKNELSLRHIEAQVAYKTEDYNSSIEIYYALLKETDKNLDVYNDILTNFNAAKAALLFSGGDLDAKYAMMDSFDTYELAYNTACTYIGLKDYGKAEKLLNTAKNMCRKSLLSEDYTEDKIEIELGTIKVQLGYVYQLQGKISEAIEIYQSVLKVKGMDVSASAIASNNLVAAKKDTELFDSARKLRVASSKNLDAKLFRGQKRVIAMNEALLLLYMHKANLARKSLQTYPENDDLYLLIASTSFLQKKINKSISDLQEFAKQKPESLHINFALMQLQLLTSNPNNALETFEKHLSSIKVDKQRYKSGYVGLLVWLYEQSGMHDKAVKTLEDAGTFWKNTSSNESTSILKQTASFKIKTGRYQEAAQDYEQLVKVDPLDTQAIAGLVSAYSHYDIEKAEKYVNSLPEINSGDGMDIDVDSIEKLVPGIKKSYKKTDNKSDGPSQKTHTKKRKRKPLLPKSYDPSIPPDPERWLPKRERSTFKAKGKRKQLMKSGSQGAAIAGGGIGGTGSANIAGKSVVSENQSAAASGGANTAQQESTAQHQQTPPKPKSDNKSKKKKKKGSKW